VSRSRTDNAQSTPHARRSCFPADLIRSTDRREALAEDLLAGRIEDKQDLVAGGSNDTAIYKPKSP